KPPKSLGRLEDLAARFCLITNTTTPLLGRKKIFTFAGDHGVAEEGVSAYPKEVTPQMVRNILAGGAAVNVLARHAGAEVCVIDMGVDDPLADAPNLIRRKIKFGTNNMAKGAAMSLEEAGQAIEAGIELARSAAQDGVTLIGTGEMGIANTTPSSALFAALLPCPVEDITGRGTGIDDAGLIKKIEVIKRALKVNQAKLSDPLSTLAAVGGLEIAGICGLCLGAAASRIPVVVDGFISSAGALVACRLCPSVREYLFFSHLSEEAGHATFLRLFKVEPILDLKMRLGEGTGAALAMSIIEASVKIYNEMATFASAGVSDKA
ncbi:MAG: nicotinate-nucleotide--dimethylbenzimidazole phosphoribosyltransferase, partial [Deltaproteobacteria bacterium]|nr:nicotinate-nucleotide--dimethylbenzimidazole phosphoribosyltransferase [Deltaproteobacteria bacterium]